MQALAVTQNHAKGAFDMLNKVKQRKDSGFTIIEVMIVLAIAGLIMVVVFLAVPALQRSGRNNALNTDANNVLTAVSNYVSNNNGTLPIDNPSALTGTTVTIKGATGTNTETATVDSGVSVAKVNGTVITNAAAKGTVQVITGVNAKCNATASGITTGGGSARTYVVLYVAESGSGNILKCIGG